MKKIGRNELCPCGSGKKFKKCHMGREDELALENLGEFSDDMSARITSLPEVRYGRSREMLEALDIEDLTDNAMGIRFVDLMAYADLNLFEGAQTEASKGQRGAVFINLYKTVKTDPDHIYIAISRDIDDSSLVHALAHALDYLGGAQRMPGSNSPLGLETGIPIEHLEHPEEFGYWLDYLKDRFEVQLDADDTIVWYLYKNNKLIKGEEIQAGNHTNLKAKSDEMFKFLSGKSQEIDKMIRSLPGYIGVREVKD